MKSALLNCSFDHKCNIAPMSLLEPAQLGSCYPGNLPASSGPWSAHWGSWYQNTWKKVLECLVQNKQSVLEDESNSALPLCLSSLFAEGAGADIAAAFVRLSARLRSTCRFVCENCIGLVKNSKNNHFLKLTVMPFLATTALQ